MCFLLNAWLAKNYNANYYKHSTWKPLQWSSCITKVTNLIAFLLPVSEIRHYEIVLSRHGEISWQCDTVQVELNMLLFNHMESTNPYAYFFLIKKVNVNINAVIKWYRMGSRGHLVIWCGEGRRLWIWTEEWKYHYPKFKRWLPNPIFFLRKLKSCHSFCHCPVLN